MKKIVLALVLGMLIGSTTVTIAATNETIQATFQKFMLKINDQESIEIEPLVYKDTTYLPVRSISNMIGYDVTYKADSRTIILNSQEPEPVEEGDVVETTEEYRMEYIDHQIIFFKKQIDSINYMLSSYDLSEERIIDYETQKAEHEANLALWEQRKAELEAQTVPTE